MRWYKSPQLLVGIRKSVEAFVGTYILGKIEQQSIVDYSISKLVPHPQLLFALGLPTIVNWLPSNSVVKSIVLPLSSSNEAKSITTSAFPVPASSSTANMVSSSRSTLEGPSSDIRYWKP